MVHPESTIIDFYPIDFKNDLNGKKYQWQAVALLPFIDAARLRASLAPLAHTLTEEEAKRNSFGSEVRCRGPRRLGCTAAPTRCLAGA